MKTKMQNKQDTLDSLVDIREVHIDPTLSEAERIKSYLQQIRNPYLFRVGTTVVRVSYSPTGKTLNESFANMLAAM